MFQGTLPADALAVIAPVVRAWHCDDLAFPCSGKFTVPRSLHDMGARFHGNDVTLYSCALGEFFAGGGVTVGVKPGLDLEWLEPYLERALDRTAAVLVFSEFAEAWVKRDRGPYFRRLAGATKDQFAAMHRKVTVRLSEADLELASFFAGDCVDFVDRLPVEAGVITFPPIYRSGYERMFQHLHACFEWQAPAYQVFDGERLKTYLEKVTSRPSWLYGAQSAVEHPALEGRFLAKVQATNRSTAFYLYASAFDDSRIALPRQRLDPLLVPKLREGEPLGGKLSLVPLSQDQFAALRSQYLDPAIAPAGCQVRLAVLADGKLVGGLAFDRCKFKLPGAEEPSIYMLSDFSIGTAPRLAKLVVGAALSRECQLVLERTYGRRLRSVLTTAFSNHPASMKYRGVLRLLCRTECEPGGGHKYKLCYAGTLGERTLAETLDSWKAKHARAD